MLWWSAVLTVRNVLQVRLFDDVVAPDFFSWQSLSPYQLMDARDGHAQAFGNFVSGQQIHAAQDKRGETLCQEILTKAFAV